MDRFLNLVKISDKTMFSMSHRIKFNKTPTSSNCTLAGFYKYPFYAAKICIGNTPTAAFSIWQHCSICSCPLCITAEHTWAYSLYFPPMPERRSSPTLSLLLLHRHISQWWCNPTRSSALYSASQSMIHMADGLRAWQCVWHINVTPIEQVRGSSSA